MYMRQRDKFTWYLSSGLYGCVLLFLSGCVIEEGLNTDDPLAGELAGTEAGSIIVAGDEVTAGLAIDVDMMVIEECEIECPSNFIIDDCECVPESCLCPSVFEPVCGEDGQSYGNECEAECRQVEIQYEGECTVETTCFAPDTTPNCNVFCDTVNLCVSAYCMHPDFADSFECVRACEDEPRFFLGEFWSNLCEDTNSCEEFISSFESYIGEPICGPECFEPNPQVMYVSENPEECEYIDFDCPGAEYYYDECGCGCYVRDCDAECDEVPSEYVCSPNGERYASECHANCAGEYNYRPCEMECSCPENYEPECGLDGITYSNRCHRECVNVPLNYEGVCGGELCSDPASLQDCGRLCDEVTACYNDQCNEDERDNIRSQCLEACSYIGPEEICYFGSCFDIGFLIEEFSDTYIECIDTEINCPDEFDGAEYISYEPEVCGLIGDINCDEGESFNGACGCGCLTRNRCPQDDQARYVSFESEICERISISCPEGSEVFNNDCGCGCSY